MPTSHRNFGTLQHCSWISGTGRHAQGCGCGTARCPNHLSGQIHDRCGAERSPRSRQPLMQESALQRAFRWTRYSCLMSTLNCSFLTGSVELQNTKGKALGIIETFSSSSIVWAADAAAKAANVTLVRGPHRHGCWRERFSAALRRCGRGHRRRISRHRGDQGRRYPRQSCGHFQRVAKSCSQEYI